MNITENKQYTLIRFCYLLPLVCALVLLALGFIPRFFYQSGSEAFGTMSLFGLLDNTCRNCIGFLDPNAKQEASTSAFYFALIMMVFWALSWVLILLYALFALFTAFLGMMTWTPDLAANHTVNQLKRAYRILVPNRGFFVAMNLYPLLPACFPYLLQIFYRSVLSEQADVYYFGIPDPVIVMLLGLLPGILFLFTLSMQKEHRMDIFRLYKPQK